MPHYILKFLIFSVLFCLPADLFAQEPAQEIPAATPYGISMHGAPKYTAASTHLDTANPDAPKGGKIKMDAIGTFDTLNPYSIKGKAAQGLNLVYDRLMSRVWEEPFSMYPLIAESYEMPEDRSSITFHINPKARFQDGTPITAEDVLFSFETLKTEGRPNMRNVYRLVSKATKPDEMTVHFEFAEGYDRETALIMAMMPVLSKAYWETRTFDQTTLDIPNTNGAYRIKSFEPGRTITYERNPDYWAKDLLPNVGHNNFDEITYDYYRDDTVAFEAFKSGDLDLRRESDAGKWASAYDFPAVQSGKVMKDTIAHGRPERTRGFIFNTRRAPFDDIRVRKALEMLFDFEWVNNNLFHGQYKQIDSYFPNSELASPLRNVGKTQISPREKMRSADALLKDAGWLVVDGKRMKDGKPLSFELLLDAPEQEKIALHYKRALERMGIEMRIRVLDSAAFRGRLNEYDFDMVSYFWQSSLSPGTEQILYWGCEAGKQPARWNFPGICDPAIDKLANAVAQTKTREDLVRIMQTLDQHLLRGHYMIPLYYAGADYVAYDARIKRPEKVPLYGMVLESWWMDEQNP